MLNCYGIAFLLVFLSFITIINASAGDADPHYKICVNQCEETGCFREKCFPNCKFSLDEVPNIGHPWNMLEPLYVHWKKGDCQSNCQYYCMLDKEKERELHSKGLQKYYGKWPFKSIYGIQEPASMAFSVLNLVMHFHGWMSFFTLLYNQLPLKAGKRPYYEYASLWHVYGLLSLNSWFWSVIFHTRYCELIERLDYSSTVALLGYSFIVAILRSFNVKDEATRVMISAPLISFVITHIMYLNFFKLDHEWNLKVCVLINVAQLATWAIWSGVSHHPSRWKHRFVVLFGGFAMFLEIYDFPPYEGLVDAHALRHAITIPLTYLLWSFIRDDATFLTSKRLDNSKKSK
ncbi:post-GPI attachment to proteins factor 3 [Cajanus cajan]|uniref:post-GPI attachment to proteins factor 3 n=1 Tax=Cajanus cajan TaxID=3821 RepID=UPI0010FB93CD|nr:post-GPI attachment to proteins factor 3 [Cajanus cajan]